MLLHRGHGIILSGFLGDFSCCVLVSLCSPDLDDFSTESSFSGEGNIILGLSQSPEDVGDFKSSVV